MPNEIKINISQKLQNAILSFDHHKAKLILQEALNQGIDVHEFKKECMLAFKKNYLKCAEVFLSLHILENDTEYSESKEMVEYHFVSEMVREGNLEAIKLLVKYNADIERPSFLGGQPIFIAAQMGRLDIVDYFIDQGIDINITSYAHGSLLHVLTSAGQDHGVQYLINKGADILTNVNILNKDGLSPLFIACNKRHDNVIDLLLANGADIDCALKSAISRNNKSAIHDIMLFAEKHNKPFEDYQAIYDKLLLLEVRDSKLKALEQLLEKGADINAQDEKGCTPFLLAIKKNHLPSLDILIKAGSDIHHTDNKGNNAFYYAVKSRSSTPELFSYLIGKGVQPTMHYYENDTQKSLIKRAKEPGVKAFLKAMEEKIILETAIDDGQPVNNCGLSF